ncbi:MAG: hypothetical protein J0M12_07570 [Deltaproteobacteria bacterium]|nr:hypothetical protein [Deltaproteobacteria bacterium]
MSAPETTADFKTKAGALFSGFSSASIAQMHKELAEEFCLTKDVVAEAASYSMAMVVRFALGLSASGGKVCSIAKDTLAGYVALATIRHLVNAGAQAQVLLLLDPGVAVSQELTNQVTALEKLGVMLPDPESADEMDAFTQFLKDSHNIIFGIYNPGASSDEFITAISELLNEERTPVHCIEAPPGLNVDTGLAEPGALYASSTLSLGAPLKGLNKGKDFVGRHYVCDISFARSTYAKHGSDLTGLFAEQPVQQIYPTMTDES